MKILRTEYYKIPFCSDDDSETLRMIQTRLFIACSQVLMRNQKKKRKQRSFCRIILVGWHRWGREEGGWPFFLSSRAYIFFKRNLGTAQTNRNCFVTRPGYVRFKIWVPSFFFFCWFNLTTISLKNRTKPGLSVLSLNKKERRASLSGVFSRKMQSGSYKMGKIVVHVAK